MNQAFDYTRAGREWLRHHGVDFVARIPIRLETQPRNGRTTVCFGHFPVSDQPQPLDRAIVRSVDTNEDTASAKERSLRDMANRGTGQFDAADQLHIAHAEN